MNYYFYLIFNCQSSEKLINQFLAFSVFIWQQKIIKGPILRDDNSWILWTFLVIWNNGSRWISLGLELDQVETLGLKFVRCLAEPMVVELMSVQDKNNNFNLENQCCGNGFRVHNCNADTMFLRIPLNSSSYRFGFYNSLSHRMSVSHYFRKSSATEDHLVHLLKSLFTSFFQTGNRYSNLLMNNEVSLTVF